MVYHQQARKLRPTQPPLRHRSTTVPSMTQLTLTRSFLKHSQPLLTKCLQAALIAAPALLAAAPSEAATVKTVVNGFTGSFAPIQWNRTPSSLNAGNSSLFTDSNTKITLVKNVANNPRVTANVDITDSLFSSLAPYAGVGRILGWTATGNYTWGITGAAPNTRYRFGVDSNNDSDSPLNTVAPTSGTFSVGDSYLINPFDGANSPDIADFSIVREAGSSTTGFGTAVISDFQFVAEYDVPGPLPVVGAAAAFAWSRRLRKRLNSAKTLA